MEGMVAVRYISQCDGWLRVGEEGLPEDSTDTGIEELITP